MNPPKTHHLEARFLEHCLGCLPRELPYVKRNTATRPYTAAPRKIREGAQVYRLNGAYVREGDEHIAARLERPAGRLQSAQRMLGVLEPIGHRDQIVGF